MTTSNLERLSLNSEHLADVEKAAEYHKKSGWGKKLLIAALVLGAATAGLGAMRAHEIDFSQIPLAGDKLNAFGDEVVKFTEPQLAKLSEHSQGFLKYVRNKYNDVQNWWQGVSPEDSVASPSDIDPPVNIPVDAALGTAAGAAGLTAGGLAMTGNKNEEKEE